MSVCSVCGHPPHFCECGIETGHYGPYPAQYCDGCRLIRIKKYGFVGDEPRVQLPFGRPPDYSERVVRTDTDGKVISVSHKWGWND